MFNTVTGPPQDSGPASVAPVGAVVIGGSVVTERVNEERSWKPPGPTVMKYGPGRGSVSTTLSGAVPVSRDGQNSPTWNSMTRGNP